MLYEITLRSRYLGEPVYNTFNYVADTIPAGILGSFGLGVAFGAVASGEPIAFATGSILEKLRGVLSDEYKFESVVIRAPREYDVTDFYEFGYPVAPTGAQGGVEMSAFNAFGLYSNRVRLDIRRGFKRFAGVCENQVEAGGVLGPTTFTYLGELATMLSDDLTYTSGGSTVTYKPCIVSKEMYITDKGNKAYQYYETLAEQLDHLAVSPLWSAYQSVRHQTSRGN